MIVYLASNPTLQLESGAEFDLGGNAIGVSGAAGLAHALRASDHLPEEFLLNLRHNNIGPEGAEALARALRAAEYLPKGFQLDLS